MVVYDPLGNLVSYRKGGDSYIVHECTHAYPNASANPVPSLPAGFGANFCRFSPTD